MVFGRRSYASAPPPTQMARPADAARAGDVLAALKASVGRSTGVDPDGPGLLRPPPTSLADFSRLNVFNPDTSGVTRQDAQEILRRSLLGQSLPARAAATSPYNVGNLYGAFNQYANPFQNQFQPAPPLTYGQSSDPVYDQYIREMRGPEMYGEGPQPSYMVSEEFDVDRPQGYPGFLNAQNRMGPQFPPGMRQPTMYGGIGQFLPSQSMYQPSYMQQVLAQQNAQMYNPFFSQGMPGFYQNAPFEQPIRTMGGYGGMSPQQLFGNYFGNQQQFGPSADMTYDPYNTRQFSFDPYAQQQSYNPFAQQQQSYNPFAQQRQFRQQPAQNPFASMRQGLGSFVQRQQQPQQPQQPQQSPNYASYGDYTNAAVNAAYQTPQGQAYQSAMNALDTFKSQYPNPSMYSGYGSDPGLASQYRTIMGNYTAATPGFFQQQQQFMNSTPYTGPTEYAYTQRMGGTSGFTKPDMSALSGRQDSYTPVMGNMNMAMPQSPGDDRLIEDIIGSYGLAHGQGGGGGGGGGIF